MSNSEASNSVSILDCTLRDGGYINQWQFDDTAAIGVLASLISAGIDCVECGYLAPTRGQKANSTLFPNIEAANHLISLAQDHRATTLNRAVEKKAPVPIRPVHSKFALMINVGEFDCASVPPKPKGTGVSVLRLAFHKHDLDQALADAECLQAKGYRVCVQPMVTPNYSDSEILELIRCVNSIRPFALYIVDSFGSMTVNEVQKLYTVMDGSLDPAVRIGFHSHNNKQLSYASAVALVELISGSRQVIVDASIHGMGRGAGNLLTEIFSDYINQNFGRRYQVNSLLQVIDNYLEAIYRENYWGYSVAHYLSATVNCHPNYASYLTNKKTLPIAAIQSILESISNSHKVGFDKHYIEQLYLRYQSDHQSQVNSQFTIKKLKLFDERVTPIILGSGFSLQKEKNKVCNFIRKSDSLSIAINHLPVLDEPVDYLFFSNQKRYSEHGHAVEDTNKLIVTSNITTVEKHNNCFRVSYTELYDQFGVASHNAALLLLTLLTQQGFKSAWLAGIDGYTNDSRRNYSYKEMGRIVDSKEIADQNQEITEALITVHETIYLRFLTQSAYSRYLPKKILGVIPARFGSSRFPGKPLALINGIPMIHRTYRQAEKVQGLDLLIVATDNTKVAAYCEENRIPVVMTSINCLTGTDRLAEVAEKLDYDLYINIQGDEPVIDPRVIESVINEFNQYGDSYAAYNCYKKIDRAADTPRESIIKVIVNHHDELMYMSRLAVPYNGTSGERDYLKQVCVYAYSSEALCQYAKQGKTINEKFEDIELLRLLDLGFKVKMIETNFDSIAVDVPEDIGRVEQFLQLNR